MVHLLAVRLARLHGLNKPLRNSRWPNVRRLRKPFFSTRRQRFFPSTSQKFPASLIQLNSGFFVSVLPCRRKSESQRPSFQIMIIARTRLSLVAVTLVLWSAVFLPAAVAQIADLSVTKTGPDQAAAGSDITYTIHLFNTGPDASLQATLTDQIPGGTTFVSLTAPAGWTCSTPAIGTSGTITCTRPSVPVGADDLFTSCGQHQPTKLPPARLSPMS